MAAYIFRLFVLIVSVALNEAPTPEQFEFSMSAFFPVSIANMKKIEDVRKEMKKLDEIYLITLDVITMLEKKAGEDYIWDKVNKKIAELKKDIENKKYSFMADENRQSLKYYEFILEFIQFYVDSKLPQQLKGSIFHVSGNKTASNFQVKQQSLARKLSLFILEEWLLYAILEFAKFHKEMETWLLVHWPHVQQADLYIPDNEKFEKNIVSKFGGHNISDKDLFRFPYVLLSHIEDIGNLQSVYANYMARGYSNRTFTEDFPQLQLNILKMQNAPLEKLSNGLYSSKPWVAALRSRIITDEEVKAESEVVEYLN
ncbi:hypothetical protein DdX_18379 [Ditylenchus destructor]|uniref:Uncharacterized protein n=1 Tax=Ditylenchus destructor TaxID=166010 RepID=A0AAD4MK08_9BILA|nr:hypothetical protein DdX_18379 [Ditylenchus destructor]